jgi:hypothetical protein
MGDPRTTKHLGGPESPDKLRERQGRYERLEGGDRIFKIVDVASGAGVGSVGFLSKDWREGADLRGRVDVRAGVPGRGIAVAATARGTEPAKLDDKQRHARPPERRQCVVERALPQARFRAARSVRVRVPEKGPRGDRRRARAHYDDEPAPFRERAQDLIEEGEVSR